MFSEKPKERCLELLPREESEVLSSAGLLLERGSVEVIRECARAKDAGQLICDYEPQIVISPGPVGRWGKELGLAVRQHIEGSGSGALWWQFSPWVDSPLRNLFAGFSPGLLEELLARLPEVLHPLRASRARASAELWKREQDESETAFAYGDLLFEVSFQQGKWLASRPRMLSVCDGMAGRSVFDGPDVRPLLEPPLPEGIEKS